MWIVQIWDVTQGKHLLYIDILSYNTCCFYFFFMILLSVLFKFCWIAKVVIFSFSIYLLWKYLVFVYSLSIICVLFYKWSGCKSLLGLLLSLHVCCLLSEVAVYMNTTEVLWHSHTVLVICWVSFIHLTIPIHSVEWKSSLFKLLNFKSCYVLIWANTFDWIQKFLQIMGLDSCFFISEMSTQCCNIYRAMHDFLELSTWFY